ncbi:MAG: hypothetical protein ACYSW8_32950 [Planctomycetota bacterium]|jgi:hypothetical protein
MSEDGRLTVEDHAFNKVRITPHVMVATEKAARLYAAQEGIGWSEAIEQLLFFGIRHARENDRVFDDLLSVINA